MSTPAATVMTHKARKRFGQHFLHDQNIIHKIISALNPQPGQNIVEIGPGQGALTLPLLKRCQRLTAIELDRDLIPILQHKSVDIGELTLVNQDVLNFDLATLELDPPFRMVGNLPYNISTPLMFHLLKSSSLISDMVFMLQKEVAQRIIADPHNKLYGKLTVMMQYFCESEYLFDVPPGCFSPPPRVDSAVIRLRPHSNLPVNVDVDELEKVVSAAFNQRRKTINNSLKNLIDRSTISSLGIDPSARAENLTLNDFVQLTQAMLNQ
jgi:16S rRNA (adenine1518-N6/adenine1519-N6)-dimethyltransferase